VWGHAPHASGRSGWMAGASGYREAPANRRESFLALIQRRRGRKRDAVGRNIVLATGQWAVRASPGADRLMRRP